MLRYISSLVLATIIVGCGAAAKPEAAEGGKRGGRELREDGPSLASDSCRRRPAGFALSENALLEEARAEIAARFRAAVPAFLEPVILEATADGAASHFEVELRFQDIPLCGYPERAHVFHRGPTGMTVLMPTLPSASPPVFDAFGAPETLARLARDSLAAKAAQVRSAKRCWRVTEKTEPLVPAWTLVAELDGEPYRVLGTAEKLVAVEPWGFGMAEGTALTYKRGPQDGALAEVALPGLDGSGRLAGDWFRAVDGAGRTAGPQSADLRFAPAEGTTDFEDVSLFAHASEMMAWFLAETRLAEDDCAPIELEMRNTREKGNARYFPSYEADGHPRIAVGTDVPGALANLHTDFDVIAHELGHHFIHRRVKDKRPGSTGRILHEGLADFFVYAATGNACLAESICTPEASCMVQSQCLRTSERAIRDVRFHDEVYDHGSTYESSLAVSSFLLDLARDPAIGELAARSVAFGALEFLEASPDLDGFLRGLVHADAVRFEGRHGCAILAAARTAGLVEEAGKLACD